MPRLYLLTVGTPSERAIAKAVGEYVHRLQPPFWELTWTVVGEVGYRRGQQEMARRQEGERILAKIPPRAFAVLLDVLGQEWTTEELLVEVGRWRGFGRPLVFVVGGSLGVDDAVKQRADVSWSLSRLTLPHALAQLLVAEQLYRIAMIEAHHPYHKA